MTQQEMVKEYLERYGSISTLQAYKDLYIMDLQGVIRTLKKKGMPIESRYLYKRNRFGKRVKFKKYYVRDDSFFRRLANWISE